jgi:hypothetical protein
MYCAPPVVIAIFSFNGSLDGSLSPPPWFWPELPVLWLVFEELLFLPPAQPATSAAISRMLIRVNNDFFQHNPPLRSQLNVRAAIPRHCCLVLDPCGTGQTNDSVSIIDA